MSTLDSRTALARAIRDERLITSRFGWDTLDHAAQEEWRRRADHILRQLKSLGFDIVRTGEENPLPQPPASTTILSCLVAGAPGFERQVRLDDAETWSIGLRDRKTGEVKVEQAFTLDEASILSGMVLASDPEATKRPGLGRLLAAQAEIYRLNAARMKA